MTPGNKVFLTVLFPVLFIARAEPGSGAGAGSAIDFSGLKSPVVLHGDSKRAFRDPAALYHEGKFYLFYTLVQTEADGLIYSYTAVSKSGDLEDWSAPRIITPKGQHLNFSSPGNVVRFGDEWILCLQTYPRLKYRRGERLRWAAVGRACLLCRARI